MAQDIKQHLGFFEKPHTLSPIGSGPITAPLPMGVLLPDVGNRKKNDWFINVGGDSDDDPLSGLGGFWGIPPGLGSSGSLPGLGGGGSKGGVTITPGVPSGPKGYSGSGGNGGSEAAETEKRREELNDLLERLQQAVDVLNALNNLTPDPLKKKRIERYLRDITEARRALTAANSGNLDAAIRTLLADLEDEMFLELVKEGMEMSGATKTARGLVAMTLIELIWTYKSELGVSRRESMVQFLLGMMIEGGSAFLTTAANYFDYLFHPWKIWQSFGWP